MSKADNFCEHVHPVKDEDGTWVFWCDVVMDHVGGCGAEVPAMCEQCKHLRKDHETK